MKKLYALVLMLACTIGWSTAQTVNNPGFEDWENEGTNTEEPLQWNSFMTAGGTLSAFAAKQLKKSTLVRPGSTGTSSALLWSRETFSIVANGNLTTGKINMGNYSPTNQDNYNATVTADAQFNEAFTADPDSIVFWVRFIPASGTNADSGRVHAVIHDNYEFRDPTASDVNGPNHIYSQATAHFAKTDGNWARISAPFIAGPAATASYMLISITTNKDPGGGSGGDSLYIDDVEFIYNGASVQENSIEESMNIFANQGSGQLVARFNFDKSYSTDIRIYDITGQVVLATQKELMNNTEVFDISMLNSGLYFIQASRSDGMKISRKFVIR